MMRALKGADFAPNGMPRYELSRMQTRDDCSRRICLAVRRSATRMALPPFRANLLDQVNGLVDSDEKYCKLVRNSMTLPS